MIAEVSKITKSDQCELTFTFIEFSETANNLKKLRQVLEIKTVASFIKTHFIEKEDS